jgi:hypothetical protein
MKKYLVAAFVALLGVFNATAQENKTIEVFECEANKLTVEGSTLICTGFGHWYSQRWITAITPE